MNNVLEVSRVRTVIGAVARQSIGVIVERCDADSIRYPGKLSGKGKPTIRFQTDKPAAPVTLDGFSPSGIVANKVSVTGVAVESQAETIFRRRFEVNTLPELGLVIAEFVIGDDKRSPTDAVTISPEGEVGRLTLDGTIFVPDYLAQRKTVDDLSLTNDLKNTLFVAKAINAVHPEVTINTTRVERLLVKVQAGSAAE